MSTIEDAERPARLRVEIFPADLDRSVRFYTRILGFVVERNDRADGTAYVALRRGDVRVGAAQRDLPTADGRRPPVGVELVLEVDDLPGVRQGILDAGGELDEDLVLRPWGLRDIRLLDPDGYYWRLTEHPAR